MSLGYSLRTITLLKEADAGKIGVRLGLHCVENDIPVTQVAADLGVTRAAVYNWFRGTAEPSNEMVAKIKAYLSE